jgi:large subunit ribosomal protein L21
MFAVIADGGRQFRIQEGDTFLIDYREGAEEGASIQFEQVLLANGGGPSQIGTPAISGALVEATVVRPKVNGPKLEIGKFRRRKNSRRHTGHRQRYTSVRVTSIKVPGLKIEKKSASEK